MRKARKHKKIDYDRVDKEMALYAEKVEATSLAGYEGKDLWAMYRDRFGTNYFVDLAFQTYSPEKEIVYCLQHNKKKRNFPYRPGEIY